MPSKKQRRRREKTFRHEYDLVTLDEDGNEVSLDPEVRRAEREERERAKAPAKTARSKTTASRNARGLKEPPLPTWDRAFKRGGVMGIVMFLAMQFFLKDTPAATRLVGGLFYGVMFVPLTYWVDRAAYKAYERRLAKANAKR